MLCSRKILCGTRRDLADGDISDNFEVGRQLSELCIDHSLVIWRGSAPIARHEALRGRRLSCCRHQIDLCLRCCWIKHHNSRDHRVNIVLLQCLGELLDVVVIHGKHWSSASSFWNLPLMVSNTITYCATAYLPTENNHFVLLTLLQSVNQRLAHVSRSSGDCNDDHCVSFQVAGRVDWGS